MSLQQLLQSGYKNKLHDLQLLRHLFERYLQTK
jgi:hypothetical protein